jgi:hypothetical protein
MLQNGIIEIDKKIENFKLLKEKKYQLVKILADETVNPEQVLEI